jgi:hypothetical protein
MKQHQSALYRLSGLGREKAKKKKRKKVTATHPALPNQEIVSS